MFWHNLLKRFIFAYLVRSNTKIPTGCREAKTKRFNKYLPCLHAYVHMRACVGALVAAPPEHRESHQMHRTAYYGKNAPL